MIAQSPVIAFIVYDLTTGNCLQAVRTHANCVDQHKTGNVGILMLPSYSNDIFCNLKNYQVVDGAIVKKA